MPPIAALNGKRRTATIGKAFLGPGNVSALQRYWCGHVPHLFLRHREPLTTMTNSSHSSACQRPPQMGARSCGMSDRVRIKELSENHAIGRRCSCAPFYLTPNDQTFSSRFEFLGLALAVTVWLSSRGAAAINRLAAPEPPSATT